MWPRNLSRAHPLSTGRRMSLAALIVFKTPASPIATSVLTGHESETSEAGDMEAPYHRLRFFRREIGNRPSVLNSALASVSQKDQKTVTKLFSFRNRDIEAVQRCRHQAVETDEIDHLIGPTLTERIDSKSI